MTGLGDGPDIGGHVVAAAYGAGHVRVSLELLPLGAGCHRCSIVLFIHQTSIAVLSRPTAYHHIHLHRLRNSKGSGSSVQPIHQCHLKPPGSLVNVCLTGDAMRMAPGG